MLPTTTRAEAKVRGEKTYFTGMPCPNGHISVRQTSNGGCRECALLRTRTWRKENPRVVLEGKRRWEELNPLKHRRIQNRANRKYASTNPAMGAAKAAKYRAARLQATPVWADFEEIGRVYEEASRLGMQVDHIVPLQGRLVCGLHVHNNLQLLSSDDNKRKGNSRWPNMP